MAAKGMEESECWFCLIQCGRPNDISVKKQWLSIHEGLGYLFLLFVLLQLGLGYWRHYHYRVHQKRDWKSIVHDWFGRVLMLLVFGYDDVFFFCQAVLGLRMEWFQLWCS